MKHRRILSGVASILIVGMFYTFAFSIAKDVSKDNISAGLFVEEQPRIDAPAEDTDTENTAEASDETSDDQSAADQTADPSDTENTLLLTGTVLNTPVVGIPVFRADIPADMTIPNAVPLDRYSGGDEITVVSDDEESDEVTDSNYNENSDLNADGYSLEELDALFPEEDDIEEYHEVSAEGKNAKSSSDDNSSSKKKRKKKKQSDTAAVASAEMPVSGGDWDGTVNIDNSGDGKPVYSAETNEVFTVKVHGEVAEYNAYDLVCMIVANEMSPSFSKEALKAQAVAAYSYVKYHEYNGLTASVLIKQDVPDQVMEAVSEVFGECCYYNGAPAQTVYTASTSGFTASAAHVWGGSEVPYLTHQTCAFDVNYDPNYGVSTTYTIDEMRRKLQNYLGCTLSDDPSRWLVITEYEDGNYVKSINVDGQYVINGRQMRENVMGYGIKSASFEISFDGEQFTITTYGYGHGVGMSQNGANILAKQGYTYDEILKFYYPGVTVQ